MNLMMFKFDILPEPQKILWPTLCPVSKLGFVLYGGTAAALRFGHRKSADFDFFSSEHFTERQLINILPGLAECKKVQDAANTYSYITNYGARISFLGGFAFGRIGYPDMDIETGIQIASPEDVFALKLRALHDRIALKDFLDIAEFIRQKYSLEDALLGAQTLIKGMFPPEITVKALLWYDDPEFDEFSRQDRDVIANACAVIDFEKIGNNTLKLTSQTLQDEKLWQTFQSLPKRNNATLPAGPLFPHHPV